MKKLLFICSSFLLFSCTDENENLVSAPENPAVAYQSDFLQGTDGWIGDFADYPVEDSVFYELAFAHTTLPEPLDTSKRALMLKGANRSDDLFMFMYRKFTGLNPNTSYSLTIFMEIASQYPLGMIGIGGPPAESVYLKAGLVNILPQKRLTTSSDIGFPSDFYVMNIDKGNQSQSGEDMKVIGDIGFEGDAEYTLIERHNNDVDLSAQSNANGELWVVIGTDSGFEGTTELYYSTIQVFLNEQP